MTDPVDLKPLSTENWAGRLSRVINDMGGRPLNVHGLMAHNPTLLDAWWDLRMHVVKGGELSERHRELVVLRVAVHMRSWYEWASHVERGLAVGLALPEIERVRRGEYGADGPPEDVLVLRAVDECFSDRSIGADTLRALGERFTPAQILDLIALCGIYVTLGVMANTWELEIDDTVQLPAEITREQWLND